MPRQRCPRALLGAAAVDDDCIPNDLRSFEKLGRDYNGLMDVIEKEMCTVAGLEGIQAEARTRRSASVKYWWRAAVGDDAEGAAKSTSASRAWRKTAVWLGDVLNTKSAKGAEAARWRIRFHRHPKPDPASATQEQFMSMKIFEDWRGCIQHGQLNSAVRLGMLRHVANRQAEKEEAAAQFASLMNYKIWVEDGPARGLRRQHQFPRNATGWTENALSRRNGNGELGERDDLDGMSEEQIDAIKNKVCDPTSPAYSQIEANDQATAWKEVWELSSPIKKTQSGHLTWEKSRRCSWLRLCSMLRTRSRWKLVWDGIGCIRGSSTDCRVERCCGFARCCMSAKGRGRGPVQRNLS